MIHIASMPDNSYFENIINRIEEKLLNLKLKEKLLIF